MIPEMSNTQQFRPVWQVKYKLDSKLQSIRFHKFRFVYRSIVPKNGKFLLLAPFGFQFCKNFNYIKAFEPFMLLGRLLDT